MHVAIIMDGNRRWAKEKGWLKFQGHKAGVNLLHDVLSWCPKYDIDTLTIYALSTENLKREEDELNNLYDLIRDFAQESQKFIDKNIRVKILGKYEEIRSDAVEALNNLMDITKDCDGILFQICINYGGRDELTRAMQQLQSSGDEIKEENIQKHLDSSLEPELIIRTGGKHRLSNFLAWQGTYSELLFLDKMWPDFNEKDLKNATAFFRGEQRNFGE